MANVIRQRWDQLSTRPGGKWLFSKALGWMAPYTGTIGARVQEVRPGYAKATIRQKRRLQQHLGSVHAAALFNLCEMTSALAMMYALPGDARGIPTSLSIEYLKKARGLLTAEGKAPIVESSAEGGYDVEVEVKDEAGDVVTKVVAHWLIRPSA